MQERNKGRHNLSGVVSVHAESLDGVIGVGAVFVLVQNIEHLQDGIELGKTDLAEFGVVAPVLVDGLLHVLADLLRVLHRHLPINLVHAIRFLH
jgi:hypothetical protein